MNEIVTIELHHHIDQNAPFGNKNEFFNFKIKAVKPISEIEDNINNGIFIQTEQY